MKRSVRNGIAIAGMAGGLWFLGQAVASADTGQVADANAPTSVSQDGSGGGGNANLSENNASAQNVQVTKVETNVSGGNGGTNNATINTGIAPGYQSAPPPVSVANVSPSGPPKHEDSGTTVTVNTGDVTLNQQANGGSVSNSGNVAV